MDIIGFTMVAIGILLVTTMCIKDFVTTLKEEVAEDEDEDIDYDKESSDASSIDMEREAERIANLYKPVLISRDLSPVNQDAKVPMGKDIRVISCNPKIHPHFIRVHHSGNYNLPAVEVDA